MNLAYTSEDCNIFAEALEHAWEMYLKTGRLTKDNLDTAKAALSYAILQAAAGGERNARRLRITGTKLRVIHFHCAALDGAGR